MRIARNCRIFLWGALFAAALASGAGFTAAQEEADTPLYNTQGEGAGATPAPIFLNSPGGKGTGGGKAAVKPYDFSQGGAGKAAGPGAGGGLAETQAKINADITAKTKALTSSLAKEAIAKLGQAGELTRKQMKLADAEVSGSTPAPAKSSAKKKMVFDPNAQKKKGEERKNRIFNFR